MITREERNRHKEKRKDGNRGKSIAKLVRVACAETMGKKICWVTPSLFISLPLSRLLFCKFFSGYFRRPWATCRPLCGFHWRVSIVSPYYVIDNLHEEVAKITKLIYSTLALACVTRRANKILVDGCRRRCEIKTPIFTSRSSDANLHTTANRTTVDSCNFCSPAGK